MVNTLFEVITSLTGLVGTVGGVLISYFSLRHIYQKDRHKVNLEIKVANLLTPKPDSDKPDWSEDMLTFKLANVGSKEFTVVLVGLKLGKRSGGIYINQPNGTVTLPYILKSDTTCDFWSEYEALVKKIKKPKFRNKINIRGYVSDYIGNTFYSRKLPVYIKETKLHKLKLTIRKDITNFIRLFLP